MIVYGPYAKANGRQFVVHYDEITQTRRTQTYPRYLMEQHLGRKLEEWEQVDHINNDPTDDRIENYQLLTRKENIAKSTKGPAMMTFKCPVCGTEFRIMRKRYNENQIKKAMAGPFCSRHCARTYDWSDHN